MIDEDKIKEFVNTNFKEHINSSLNSNKSSLLEIKYESLSELGLEFKEFSDFLVLFEKSLNEYTDNDNHIYIHIVDMPTNCKLSSLDAGNIGSFISTTAMVKSITNSIPIMVRGIFECSKCRSIVEVNRDENNILVGPTKCPSCGSSSIHLNEDMSLFENQKILHLEEPLEFRRSGLSPKFKAYLKGYLAGSNYIIRVGDVVNISGIFTVESLKNSKDYNFLINLKSIKPEKSLFGDDDISKEDEYEIRKLSKKENIFNILVDSIAPKISGNRHIKEGLVLQQFEAESNINNTWSGNRGTIHILLIGDPSLGKTKFLDSISKIAPKYVRTGTGSTGVGLTASVTREDGFGEFVINAGAVVLADLGIILMDEFDKIAHEDQKSLNEAMESMIVSISKANITQTLSARTSFLCAANPLNSRFDIYKDINTQINIPDSTLSRFDLIYVMTDKIDEKRDYKLMYSILKDQHFGTDEGNIISSDMFMKYVAYAKMKIKPKLTNEVIEHISQFYSATRKEANECDDVTPITTRDGRAIARLSIARAKCELREEVNVGDVADAIRIYTDSVKTLGLDLAHAGVIGGNRSKRELELIRTFEGLIKEHENNGFYKLTKEDIRELKNDVMNEKGASLMDVDRAFNKAYKNINGY